MGLNPDDTPTIADLSIEELHELGERYGLRPQDLDGETPLRDLVPSEVPSEVTTEGRYWIHHSGGHGLHSHISEHEILDETTEDDLPPTDHKAVRALDREALERGILSGKWNVFLPEAEVDAAWECVKSLVNENIVQRAKVSTKWSCKTTDRADYVIVVYTPNYFDREDVFRVRDALRLHCGVEETIYYKPNLWTQKGIYADTAEEHGLPGARRYWG